MEMKKGLIIASTMASMLASSALACDGPEGKKESKKLSDDTISLGDGCGGKDGCKGEKKPKKLLGDAIELGDGCKGKDGCKGEKPKK